MSATAVETAFDTFTRRIGERAAMVAVSRVQLADLEPALDAVRRDLGVLLSDDELQQLRAAAHTLGRAVGADPMTTSAHADFRELVGQMKSSLLLRSLGAAAASTGGAR